MARHEISSKCKKCQEMIYAYVLDPILREWFEDLQVRRPEVHIAFTYRGKADQDRFFREGKSRAKYGASPHNYLPALAIDIFFLVDGKYHLDKSWLESIAATLPKGIYWGGNFKSFKDMPHFERDGWKSLASGFPNGNKP